jgi:hypothetical protein
MAPACATTSREFFIISLTIWFLFRVDRVGYHRHLLADLSGRKLPHMQRRQGSLMRRATFDLADLLPLPLSRHPLKAMGMSALGCRPDEQGHGERGRLVPRCGLPQ